MKVFEYLNRYLVDSEYKLVLIGDSLNIVNYLEILDFSNKEIRVKHSSGITIVKGDNLVVSKMLDEELLIRGNIKNIICNGK